MDLDIDAMTSRELHAQLLDLPLHMQQDIIRSLSAARRAELTAYIQDFQRCLDSMDRPQEPDSELDPTMTGASLSPRSSESSDLPSDSFFDEADLTPGFAESPEEIPPSLAHEARELLTSPVVLRALLRFLSESTPDARRAAIRNLTRERRHDLLAYMMSSEGRASNARTFGEEELLEPDFERLDTQSCQSTDSGDSDSPATISEEDEEEATAGIAEEEHFKVDSCSSTVAATPEGTVWPSPTSAKRLQLVFMPRNARPLGALQPQPSVAVGPQEAKAVDQTPEPPFKSIEASGLNGAALREWLAGRLSGPLCWMQLLEGMQWARFSRRKQAKQLSSTEDLYTSSAASGYGGALGGMVGGVARALSTDASFQLGGIFDCADGPSRALGDADVWVRRYSNNSTEEGLLEGITEEDIKLTFQRRCVAAHPHRSSGDLEEYLKTHINVEILRQWQQMDDWPLFPDEASLDDEHLRTVLSDTDLTTAVCKELSDVKADAKAATESELEVQNDKMHAQLLRLTWIKEKLEAEVSFLKSRGAYACIGVDPGASDAELARAYKIQALRLHPDRSGGSTEAFQALQAAYERILKQRGGEGKKQKAATAQGEAEDKSHTGNATSASHEKTDHSPTPASAEAEKTSDDKKEDFDLDTKPKCPKRVSEASHQDEGATSLEKGRKHDDDVEKQAQGPKSVPESRPQDERAEKAEKDGKQRNDDSQKMAQDSTPSPEAKGNDEFASVSWTCSKERAADEFEDIGGFGGGPFVEGLEDAEDTDADLWDASRLERSVSSAAEAIPAEIVSAQADAVLHGAQMCCRAAQLCSKAAAVGPMAWPQMKRMMTHLLEAAQHVAETCGRVGHHTSDVPGTVMPLLDAVTQQSSRLRPSMMRQVVKGTRGLLETIDKLPLMAKEIVLRQSVLVHHVAEVMSTMESLIGREVIVSTVCTGVAEVLEIVARLAREAGEAVAAAAMAVAETQRHAENLLEVLGAAGLWEKMDAEVQKDSNGTKSEGDKPGDQDDSSDDDNKEPWEQNVEWTSLLRSLNSDVLSLQKELRDLVSQEPALIAAVNPSQKEALFSIVAELLAQARKRVSRAWYRNQSAEGPAIMAAVEKPLECVFAAASWNELAVPSLEARLLRLSALLDCQLLCNMLETDLFHHTLCLFKDPVLQDRFAEVSTKLRTGFGSGHA